MKVNTNYITKTASLLTIATGCLVLAGWLFNIPYFKTVLPGIVSMRFNAAVCFILSGIALYLFNAPRINQPLKTIASVCSWMVLLTGFLTFSEYIFHWNLGIDELLWKEGPGAIGTSFPGRMSLSTSFNFMLLGFIFLMLDKRKYHWLNHALLIAIIPGSVLVIFNHLFGVSFLNSFPELTNTALHTAILFIVLCLGVFYSSPLHYIMLSFQKKIAGFFVLVSVVLSILFFAFNKNKKQAAETTNWVEHTHEVLFAAEQVNTLSNEIQSRARGYIITGEENYLPLFINAAGTLDITIRRLRIITKDNVGEQLRIDTLEKLIDTYIASGNELVNIRRKEGFEAAQKKILKGDGKVMIDRVRSIVTAIEQDENQLLVKRKAENEQSIQNSSRIIMLFLVFTVLLLLAVLILIYTNTRQRNKAEESLEKSLKDLSDYKQALDESLIVAVTDQKGIIKYVNDNFCKISKYSKDELLGQDHRIINSGYHPKEFIRELWVTIANGKIWRGELKNKAKDGNIYWVDTTIAPFLNEQGKPLQYLALRVDITERKKAEEQLLAVNKELDAFSYSVSHDLRTPLRAVNSYAHILNEDYGTQLDEEAKRLIDNIKYNAIKMGMLIEDLLAFSRLGRKEIQKSNIDMNELTKDVLIDINKSIAHSAEIKIGKLHNAKADYSLLRQVMFNLISNAVKYSSKKEHPLVEIFSEEKNGEIIFSVKDNGVGFDMRFVNKLFGVFQRLHKSEDFEGTGVGLAIVHRIISKHGGKVWAEAELNNGASFYFTLPSSVEGLIRET